MRVTQVLSRQHIGRMFEKHWWVQSKLKPRNSGVEKVLTEKGIQVVTPDEILKEKRVFEKVQVVGYKELPQPFDATHPNWSAEPLLTYADKNVLVDGLPQAKVLTNTIELKDGLPTTVVLKDITKPINKRINTIILSTNVYDAEQKKLPIVKDPVRPAWKFPRSYGITQNRRNRLIISKLLQVIESTSPSNIVQERYIFNDLRFSYPFERCGRSVQFQLTGDTVITSLKPVTAITNTATENIDLPDIFPLEPVISLAEENIYVKEHIYPINNNLPKWHPHTIFVHFNREETTNLFEEPVTDSQIYGRSLLKAFTAAASYAKQKHGDRQVLPKPVVVQCVQTDGKLFHFGILQLNTLNLEESTVKNIWYQTPMMSLFEHCAYVNGKPVLKGYNPEVVKYLYALYNNV